MGAETKVFIVLISLAALTFFYGMYLKKKCNDSSQEVKDDPRYEIYVKRANFLMILSIILIYILFAIMVMHVYFAYIGFAAMLLYIIAYSMHTSTGTPYNKIIRIEIISVIIVVVSAYLVNRFN